MHDAAFAAVKDTSEYTDRYKTTHVGEDACRTGVAKSLGDDPRCIRCQNLAAGMPADDKHVLNAVVCLQTVLREEIERKSAFCVPAKHEQSRPPRQDDHKTALSLLPAPRRRRMARDLELGSPTKDTLTEDAFLPTGVDDGSPQARRTQDDRAAIKFSSAGGRRLRRDESRGRVGAR